MLLLEGLADLQYNWWDNKEVAESVLDSVITYFQHRKAEDWELRMQIRAHFERIGIPLGELPETVRKTLTHPTDNPINPSPEVAEVEERIRQLLEVQAELAARNQAASP